MKSKTFYVKGSVMSIFCNNFTGYDRMATSNKIPEIMAESEKARQIRNRLKVDLLNSDLKKCPTFIYQPFMLSYTSATHTLL